MNFSQVLKNNLFYVRSIAHYLIENKIDTTHGTYRSANVHVEENTM